MKIAIVNDLPIAIEALRGIVGSIAGYCVAWVASDGAQAVQMCARERPDVILMDLIMPVMDGVEATRRIMAESPCPILLVTADISHNAELVFRAMGHGAIDAVDLPSVGGAGRYTSAIPLLTKLKRIEQELALAAPAARPVSQPVKEARRLIAIGASAGGPASLEKVLGRLPRDLDAAIVVVQHIDIQFAASMADWLGQRTLMPVRLAAEDDALTHGTIYFANATGHLVLKSSGQLGYVSEPANLPYVPSVDVFFQSVCAHWRRELVGVLLTGMGRDGAQGLKAMREARHYTIAEDKSTCVVYGMPKAAVELGAAVDVLPVGRIGPKLIEIFGKK